MNLPNMFLRNVPVHHLAPALKFLRTASLWTSLRRVFAIVLIATVGPVAPLVAQVAAPAQAAPHMLFITILDGEDGVSNIRERTAREPIVQVEDENHKPVAGALLLFTIQGGPNGAGASFNGLNTLSVTTNAEGKATAHGLTPNGTEGSYSIAVSASLGTIVASTIIKQSNAGGGGGGAATPTTPPPPPPTTPATTAPTTSTSSSSSSSSSSASSTATSTTRSTVTRSTIAHGGKLSTVLKSPWLFSAVGVVVVTVAVRTAVISSHGPTSITPGTGTVGAP